MAELSGDNAKLRINGYPFRFQTANADEEPVLTDTSHSEQELYGSDAVTKKRLRIGAKNASLDLVNCNPYAVAGLNLRVGAVVVIQLFINGLLGVSYSCAAFLIQKSSWNADASHLQPFSFEGRSLVAYKLPGDV